jgi:membrane protein DedA with SNARE-associated domain
VVCYLVDYFICQNGYFSVFLAVAFGGEFGLFAGVALAKTGAVSLAGIVVLGTAASFTANTIYYYAGKLLWNKWHFLRARFGEKVGRTSGVVRRFGPRMMLIIRFFYGIRDIVPIALGIYEVRGSVFALYNLIGAFVWAFVFTMLGHIFSGLFLTAVRSFHEGLLWGVAAVMAAFAVYFLIRRAVLKIRNNSEV